MGYQIAFYIACAAIIALIGFLKIAYDRIDDLKGALFAKHILLDDEPTAAVPTVGWTGTIMPGQVVTTAASHVVKNYAVLVVGAGGAGGAGCAVANHTTIVKGTTV